ncbi:ABC transporter permease [Brevibacterium salitolerans]|uniref:ABC transporter permease n=1 Tax=Brevibacterium salitolerans TaxID=1403566 RepID=UPI0031CFE992
MRSASRLLPLVLRTKTLFSAQGLLMIAAFAACSMLFLTVAGGLWAFMYWDTAADESGVLGFYKILAGIATALLLVPAVTLGQATANLAARSDTERLSSLSLLGASQSTITVLAVAQPIVGALIGTALGVIGHFLLLFPVSAIPFQGSGLGYAEMVMPWWLIALACLGLVLVSAASALMGLRKLVISPLGVRTRALERKFPWARIIVGAAALLVVGVLLSLTKGGQTMAMIVVSLLAMLIMGLLVIDILGVLLVRLIAHIGAQRAKTPDRLIAARSVQDDPKQYWRRVSGLAMTAFIAVFAGTGVAIVNAVPDDAHMPAEQLYLSGDMRTGVLLTLGIAILFVAVSAALNQTADVYDRSSTFRELHAAGMEERTVAAMTVRATMMPVIWVSLLAAGLGLVLVLPLAGMAMVMSPLTFLTLLASVAVGILVVRAGLQLSRPAIRRVTLAEVASV